MTTPTLAYTLAGIFMLVGLCVGWAGLARSYRWQDEADNERRIGDHWHDAHAYLWGKRITELAAMRDLCAAHTRTADALSQIHDALRTATPDAPDDASSFKRVEWLVAEVARLREANVGLLFRRARA